MLSRKHISHLLRDCRGAIAIEFALVGPAFILLMLGVLQVGMALQNYNAIRNVSADVARYAMVQHQTGNELSNTQVRTYAINRSQGAPYLLTGDSVNAQINTAATQRVSGARELEITVTYQVESLLGFAGIEGPYISYTRPIFLLEDASYTSSGS